jgi:hypothetical protein
MINQYRQNRPKARFLSTQEKQDLVRRNMPLYITDIFPSQGEFNGKAVAKWNFRCVPLMGGEEVLISMGKTGYRDGLVEMLKTVIAKDQRAGPVVLTFGINQNSGRPQYDFEDWALPTQSPAPPPAVLPTGSTPPNVPPVTPAPVSAPVAVSPPAQASAYCSRCTSYPVGTPFDFGGAFWLNHVCPADGAQIMLRVES